ncbi:MAG: trigger factor [Oscillospiraceae bacterium]|jgi:trigger factor
MNVKSKKKGEHSTVELVIEVDAKSFDEAVNRVYLKQRKRISIPGFRKGKAPRNMLEAMYGANLFYEDAIKDIYPAAYEEAIAQEKLKPAAYPQIEIVEVGKEGFTFKAIVTLKPDVKLGEYKGLTAPKEKVSVTDADIDAEMAPYIQRATRLTAVKRKAKKGDTAVIDFEGFDNGVPFEGGKGEGYSLELGSGTFIPGFEDGVVGMKAGEEKELDITFPEDYSPDLAGKPVVFKVKVQEVKEPVKPELDDEFAKDVSEFETLADFRADLKKKITERREKQVDTEYERAITDQLIDNLEVDLPQAIVDQQTDRMMDDYRMRVESQGIPFDQYMSMMGMNPQMLRQEAAVGARRRVLNELALEAVAKAEKLKISAAEKKAEYERLAKEYNMEVEQIKAAVDEETLSEDLLYQKAAKFVLENAKVGKAPAKKAAKKDEGEAAEKKPAAKKTTAKAKTDAAEKKPTAKKTAKKAEE